MQQKHQTVLFDGYLEEFDCLEHGWLGLRIAARAGAAKYVIAVLTQCLDS